MDKKIIFQDSFLVSGIMCYHGCGATIQQFLKNCLSDCQQENLLPKEAQLIVDAEPQALGVHRLFVMIECDEDEFNRHDDANALISTKFKESLDSIGFEVIDNHGNIQNDKSNNVNWINIIVNLIAMAVIIGLSIIFPPSLPLTIGLTALSFLTTTFTAREYLINFFRNLRNKNLTNMTTTITLGWLLSLAHTLYHSITMPLASSFSMVFMSFIMPVLLMTAINLMDEIKRLVLNKSKKMHLRGMKTLFPQMADEYPCYQLSPKEQEVLSQLISTVLDSHKESPEAFLQPIQKMLDNDNLIMERKNSLKKGMVLKVKRGECFPVDCILIQGNTLVDSSLLTGEPQQNKHLLDFIPAGAINLGQSVTVYSTQDSYNSTVNKLLFRSNRAKENSTPESNSTFTYLYGSLIVVGIATSIILPFALGILTVPLLLQNITGILFAVCPCTLAIAHQLPKLLSMYQRSNKGIILRDENLSRQFDEIHTVVFDKTGTLTTGNSQVESSEGISSSLWERIYLLEKHHGAEHPLAKAINHYYEAKINHQSMIKDIKEVSMDSKNRGLSGVVQGKQIHIGNADYLSQAGIMLPPINTNKIAKGLSPIYVAEDNIYKGVIFIKHEIRKDIIAALSRLKNEGKKIIMLTGDSQFSAIGFNQQNGSIFDSENIHAEQTPQDKENFLSELMSSKEVNPKGVWFVGDGLNDAPCARIVTEKGGVSCAMTSDDKAAFFTDISLNGSLDYLFEHTKLNHFFNKNIVQNQWIMAYGILAFLAFIIAFSIAGIAVSPLIPMVIMISTTLFTLFNSYRVQLSVDNALDKDTSWLKQCLASDVSIGLLVGASMLLMCGVLISTIASGALVLPAIVFTAGIIAALSSTCILTASVMFAAFALLGISYLLIDKCIMNDSGSVDMTSYSSLITSTEDHSPPEEEESLVSNESNHNELTFGFYKPARKYVDETLYNNGCDFEENSEFQANRVN